MHKNKDQPCLPPSAGRKGQSLVELIVVVAVIVIVVGALVFATIASIRNASFAKNQAQATKYAQEGLERVRSGRDRTYTITGSFTLAGQVVDSWQDPDLWSNQISPNCNPCYFKLVSAPNTMMQHIGTSTTNAEIIGEFRRSIILSDSTSTYTVEKTVTALVSWTDFSGPHESRLITILRKI